jgi:hypothetical protein
MTRSKNVTLKHVDETTIAAEVQNMTNTDKHGMVDILAAALNSRRKFLEESQQEADLS